MTDQQKQIEEIKYQWSFLRGKKNLSVAEMDTKKLVLEQAKKYGVKLK